MKNIGERRKNRMKIKPSIDKIVYACILGYLILPILIFVSGWLKWYFALIGGTIIIVSYILAIRADEQIIMYRPAKQEFRILFTAALIILLWTTYSGIGGICYQNSDHSARTAIFRAMVERPWPVKSEDGTRGLIYYIGFWLPSALIGKIFGFEAGYKFQIIWAALGIWFVYYLICCHRRKVELWTLIFLIFFSGLDILGEAFRSRDGLNLLLDRHLEWWHQGGLQYSSFTTQLFWVFNQAVPAWVAVAFLMNHKKCNNMLLILGSIMLCSTFPFVGFIPVVTFWIISKCRLDRNKWRKEVFTIQNMTGVLVIGIISFLYLIGNVSGNNVEDNRYQVEESTVQQKMDSDLLVSVGTGFYGTSAELELEVAQPQISVWDRISDWMHYYGIFYVVEFGFYMLLILPYQRKNPLFYVVLAELLICPFIKVGFQQDFCMRASIPVYFLLMIMCMDTFAQMKENSREKLQADYILFIVLLCVAGLTPTNEINRCTSEMYVRANQGVTNQYPESSIEEILNGFNFSGNVEKNFFYRYLAR